LYDEQVDPAELNNLAENPAFLAIKNNLSKELELLKKETGYRDEIPRPDPEPVTNLKSGKLFSVDFGKLAIDNQSGDVIHFFGVKKVEDQGEICASFQDGANVVVANERDLDPSIGSYVIDCVVKPDSPDGVIASSGSQKDGWAIYVENGIPGFVVAHNQHLQFVDGVASITGKWSHLVAVIENYNNRLWLFANGKLLGQRKMLLPVQPIGDQSGDIILGQDAGDLIDPKVISKYTFTGQIKNFSVFRNKKTEDELTRQSEL
jgi:hypothetical protein